MGTKGKIVYIEDEPMISELLKINHLSKFRDYESLFYSDGTSLKADFSKGIENVVAFVTDEDLPDALGHEIIGEYSGNPACRNVKYFLMSGDPNVEKEAKKAGVEFIGKPFSLSDFTSRIDNALGITR